MKTPKTRIDTTTSEEAINTQNHKELRITKMTIGHRMDSKKRRHETRPS